MKIRETNRLIIEIYSKPRVTLEEIGIPALNVSDHLEIAIFPSNSYKLCIQLSYSIYNRINYYFFPDSVTTSSIASMDPRRIDVDEEDG